MLNTFRCNSSTLVRWVGGQAAAESCRHRIGHKASLASPTPNRIITGFDVQWNEPRHQVRIRAPSLTPDLQEHCQHMGNYNELLCYGALRVSAFRTEEWPRWGGWGGGTPGNIGMQAASFSRLALFPLYIFAEQRLMYVDEIFRTISPWYQVGAMNYGYVWRVTRCYMQVMSRWCPGDGRKSITSLDADSTQLIMTLYVPGSSRLGVQSLPTKTKQLFRVPHIPRRC